MITDQEPKDQVCDHLHVQCLLKTPLHIIMIADQESKNQVCDHLQYLLKTPLQIIMIADQKIR